MFTFLQLINQVITLTVEGDILDNVAQASSGHNLTIKNLFNRSQTALAGMEDWYNLYAKDSFTTVASLATYAIPSDFHKNAYLVDTTNDYHLRGNFLKNFRKGDPTKVLTGPPAYFDIAGGNYELYPIPDGAYVIEEEYWRFPAVMTDDDDTLDLPDFVENAAIDWVLGHFHRHENDYEASTLDFRSFKYNYQIAKDNNSSIVSRPNIINPLSQLDVGYLQVVD